MTSADKLSCRTHDLYQLHTEMLNYSSASLPCILSSFMVFNTSLSYSDIDSVPLCSVLCFASGLVCIHQSLHEIIKFVSILTCSGIRVKSLKQMTCARRLEEHTFVNRARLSGGEDDGVVLIQR